MKRINFLFLFLFITLTSCLKDSQEFLPNKETGDAKALLSKIDDFANSVALNPAVDNTIITASNEVIFVPANTVRNSDNSPAEGSVLMTYGVYKSNALDVIRNRDSKVGNASKVSLFNIVLELAQGNKKLIIGEDTKGISFRVPYNTSENQTQPNLYLWYSDNWIPDLKSSILNTNWKIETNNGTIFGIGYETNVKATGDFMVAIPSMISGTLDICLVLPDIYTAKNTVAFALFAEEKISYKLNFENGKFCTKNLPVDRTVQLISLSEQNGKYLITENKHHLTKSANISDVPKARTINEIEDWLNSF